MLLGAILIFISVLTTKAQQSIGFRFTPNIISQPKVVNPSPSKIFGERRLSFDAGIDYTHSIKKHWGLSLGIDVGIVDWNYFLQAPESAFGSKEGLGQFMDNSNSNNYFYNGVGLQPVYIFKWKNNKFRFSAGPIFRFYHNERDGETTMIAINRSIPWNPDDPNSGPADFVLELPPAGPQLRTNIITSIGVERRVSDRLNLILGIRKNWGIKPISDGNLVIQMYDKLYYGSFGTKANYLGLDLALRFNTKPSEVAYIRPAPVESDKSSYRKSVFVEVLGNGIIMSLNYDMRLQRHKNDGVGFRVGMGLGEYFPKIENDLNRYISLPVNLNYIVGKQRSGLETGIGITPQISLTTLEDNPQTKSIGYLNMGYRFQPLKDGLILRAVWTPYYYNKEFYTNWAGVSVGYSFR